MCCKDITFCDTSYILFMIISTSASETGEGHLKVFPIRLMNLPELLHKHTVILFPVKPLVTSR